MRTTGAVQTRTHGHHTAAVRHEIMAGGVRIQQQPSRLSCGIRRALFQAAPTLSLYSTTAAYITAPPTPARVAPVPSLCRSCTAQPAGPPLLPVPHYYDVASGLAASASSAASPARRWRRRRRRHRRAWRPVQQQQVHFIGTQPWQRRGRASLRPYKRPDSRSGYDRAPAVRPASHVGNRPGGVSEHGGDA